MDGGREDLGALLNIVATSDWHLDARTAGVERRDDLEDYLVGLREFLVEQEEAGEGVRSIGQPRRSEPVDLLLIGGDFFDPGTLEDCFNVGLVMWWIRELANHARDVVVIAGNHDVVEASRGEGKGAVTTLRPFGHLPETVTSFEDPGVHDVGGAAILCLPHVAACRDRAGLDERVLANLRETRRASEKLIVLVHRTIEGARLGTESREMARGRGHLLPNLDDLRPDLVVAGHYHVPQVVRHGAVDVHVVGSPFPTRFGEGSPRRGWLHFPTV